MTDYQGEKFLAFLESRKIKKIEAAKMLGIGRSALYDYFKTKHLSPETVKKITSVFGVNEWDVWGTGNLASDIGASLKVNHKITEIINNGIAKGRIKVNSDDTLQMDHEIIGLMQEEMSKYGEKLAYEAIHALPESNQNTTESNAHSVLLDNEKFNMYVVPVKAYGGFLSGYESTVFLETLERSSFPFIRGECFAFEVDGFSMYKEYVPGDYVVTTAVENLEWLSKGKVYVFQTVDGIILKCFDRVEGEYIHLYSLNEEYNPVKPIHLKDVKKVYFKEKVIKN